MLHVVTELAGGSDDPAWVGSRQSRRRHEKVLQEYRRGVTSMAGDIEFLVRCFEMLGEDGRDELTLPQLVHWVTLLIDPASSGPYGDGDIDIQADMLQKLGKQGQPPGEVVVDWQDFVLVTLDFYVAAGAYAMRRTFAALCSDGPADQPEPEPEPEPEPKLARSAATPKAKGETVVLGGSLGRSRRPKPLWSKAKTAVKQEVGNRSQTIRPTPPPEPPSRDQPFADDRLAAYRAQRRQEEEQSAAGGGDMALMIKRMMEAQARGGGARCAPPPALLSVLAVGLECESASAVAAQAAPSAPSQGASLTRSHLVRCGLRFARLSAQPVNRARQI